MALGQKINTCHKCDMQQYAVASCREVRCSNICILKDVIDCMGTAATVWIMSFSNKAKMTYTGCSQKGGLT